jgi:hypothetical protein
MKFKNYKDMLTRPFIVYADFEASLVKTHRTDGKSHIHEPNSVGIHLICFFSVAILAQGVLARISASVQFPLASLRLASEH